MSIVYALPIFIITIFAIVSVMKMVNGTVDREMEELLKKEGRLPWEKEAK